MSTFDKSITYIIIIYLKETRYELLKKIRRVTSIRAWEVKLFRSCWVCRILCVYDIERSKMRWKTKTISFWKKITIIIIFKLVFTCT